MEHLNTKYLAQAYGVQLDEKDIEELGKLCTREKFKNYFGIPEDADEDPHYIKEILSQGIGTYVTESKQQPDYPELSEKRGEDDDTYIESSSDSERAWEDYRIPLNRSMALTLEREAFIAGYKAALNQKENKA